MVCSAGACVLPDAMVDVVRDGATELIHTPHLAG